ncbi:MAG: thiamine phosphate synthase [Myxococcales bacterium]|nr:MAG: thiamine phosphate synthase [Myxococcales bacterium]
MRALPRLIAITDVSVLPAPQLVARFRRLAALARPGTVALLLRDHALSARARLALGGALRDAAREHGQALWVADRLDLALLLAADGLHLGEASVSARTARQWLPAAMSVSRAWHYGALEQSPVAELEGVDALLVSPVLAPRKERPALGLPALSALGEQLRARHQAYPLYALGGVTADTAAGCVAAGAAGVAAIGAALAPEPSPLLAALACLR